MLWPAAGRPRRFYTYAGVSPGEPAQVRKRDSRVPQQRSDDHRPALEWWRQHRAGTARDPGAARVSNLAAARHRGQRPSLPRLFRVEGAVAELALGFLRRAVVWWGPRERP